MMMKNSNNDFTNALITAIKLNKIEVAQYMFEKKCSIDKTELINKIVAIGQIDVEMFSLILSILNSTQKKIVINQVFDKAIEKNNKPEDMVKILIRIINLDCIEINKMFKNGNLLTFACKNNLIDIVKIHIQKESIDINCTLPSTGDKL